MERQTYICGERVSESCCGLSLRSPRSASGPVAFPCRQSSTGRAISSVALLHEAAVARPVVAVVVDAVESQPPLPARLPRPAVEDRELALPARADTNASTAVTGGALD